MWTRVKCFTITIPYSIAMWTNQIAISSIVEYESFIFQRASFDWPITKNFDTLGASFDWPITKNFDTLGASLIGPFDTLGPL